MDNTFTYIIRSSNKEVTSDNTSSCTIHLSGLPSQYKYFDCTVSALHVSTISGVFTTSTFELRADTMDIINGKDSTGGQLKTVALASFNNTYPQGPFTFRCGNFNGRSVRFTLNDETGVQLTSNFNGGGVASYNKPWLLVLNMVGVPNDNYN